MPARMSEPYRLQIEHLLTYITDIGAIASYLGIDRARVEKVDREWKRPLHKRFQKSRSISEGRPTSESGIVGMDQKAYRIPEGDDYLASVQRFFERETARIGCPVMVLKHHLHGVPLDESRAA